MALLREEGFDGPDPHPRGAGALTEFYKAQGIRLGDTPKVVAAERKNLGGAVVLCPPSAIQDLWSRRFPDPVTAFASGWMRVRGRARQKGVELPLIVSDHCDWGRSRALHPGDRGRRGLGHARAGGRAGALVRAARHPGAAASSSRIRGRG
jgi:hypothetical protein